MIPLTETTFRRLAQSSPWRFRTLHFSWHPKDPSFGPVEAWLTRPGHLRVREEGGSEHVIEGVPYTTSTFTVGGPPAEQPRAIPPQSVSPELDEHGLVEARPDALEIEYDDPMWQTYVWVAMLDPRELATGTTVSELVVGERHGRATWWAQVAAVAGEYDPRCGCCPLVWGEVSEQDEGAIGGPTWIETHPDVVYPESWLIGLDIGTGVVVSASPNGGSRPDAGFELVIHEVA